MSLLVDRSSRVLIQGVTGREGSFHTAQMRAFGTNVTNVGYITTLGTSNNFGSRYITWGDPAQYGVEVKAKF